MPDNKYKLTSLFGANGRIQYSDDLATPFNTTKGSSSMEHSVDNDLYLNLTKKHNGIVGITPDNLDNLIESRARRQSTADRIGNALIQTGGEFVGGTLEGTGIIVSALGRITGLYSGFTRNWLEQIGSDINEGVREAFPIYMTNQAQHGSLWDRMQGGGYWAQLVPSILGSAASIMVPARAASLLIGRGLKWGLGQAARNAKAAKLFKVATDIQKLNTMRKVDHINDIVSSAIISRTIDSSREAYETKETQSQWYRDNYNFYLAKDEKGKDKLKGEDGKLYDVTPENIEKLADEYGNRAAEIGYKYSMANIVFDVIQWAATIGAAKTIDNSTRNAIRNAMGKDDRFTILNELGISAPIKTQSTFLRNLAVGGVDSAMEMADEMTMSISMKEGAHAAKKEYGLLSDLDVNSDFSQRLTSYITDPEVLTEGIAGFFGGAGMTFLMPIIEKKFNKKGIERENAYLTQLANALETMRTSVDQIAVAMSDGDVIKAKKLETEALLDIIGATSLDGNLELYKEMLSNMSKSLHNLNELKAKKDRGETLTEEENQALDKAKNIVGSVDIFDHLRNKIDLVADIFNDEYDKIDPNTYDDKTDLQVDYELARRRARLKAYKAINNAELSKLRSNDNEYARKRHEAEIALEEYIETHYEEFERNDKRDELNNYRKKKHNKDFYESMKTYLKDEQDKHTKEIKATEDKYNELSDAEKLGDKGTIFLQAKKTLEGKLNLINKQIENIDKFLNKDENKLPSISATDVEAINEYEKGLGNTVTEQKAIEFYEMQNEILDEYLNDLNTPETKEEIKEFITLYNERINLQLEKEVKEEIDKLDTLDKLKAEKEKLEKENKTDSIKYIYLLNKIKEKELKAKSKKQDKAKEEAIRKKSEQNQRKREEQQRGINLDFDKQFNPYKIKADKSKIDKPIDENRHKEVLELFINSTVPYDSITDFMSSTYTADGKSLKEKYSDIYEYYESIEAIDTIRYYDSAISLAVSYVANFIIQTIIPNTTGTNSFAAFVKNNNLSVSIDNLESIIRDYISYLKTKSEFKTLNLTDSNIADIVNKAKTEYKRLESINTLLQSNTQLYVRIDGVDYKVEVITEETTEEIAGIKTIKGIRLRVKGIGEISPYVCSIEGSPNVVNAKYVLRKVPNDVAPVRISFSTGSYQATQSTTDVQSNQNPETKIDNIDNNDYKITESTDELCTIEFTGEAAKLYNEIYEYCKNNIFNNPDINNSNKANLFKLLFAITTSNKDTNSQFLNLYKSIINDIIAKLNINSEDIAKIEIQKDKIIIPKSILRNSSLVNIVSNLLQGFLEGTIFEYYKKAYDDTIDNDNIKLLCDILGTDEELNENAVNDAMSALMDESNPFNILKNSDSFSIDITNMVTVMSYLKTKQGFTYNKFTVYDLAKGLRMYYGDNHKNIEDMIFKMSTIAKSIKDYLKFKLDTLEAQYQAMPNSVNKKSYNFYKRAYDMLDIDTNSKDLSTYYDIRKYIDSTPIINFITPRLGLDIVFIDSVLKDTRFNFMQVEDDSIYHTIKELKPDSIVQLKPRDNKENNETEYDVVYTNSKGKEVVIGRIPALSTVVDGVSYTRKGKNNVIYFRDITITEEQASEIANIQGILYKFMYYYSIVHNKRNNVSQTEEEYAISGLNSIYEYFKNNEYNHIWNIFKNIIYGNLSSEEINAIAYRGDYKHLVHGSDFKLKDKDQFEIGNILEKDVPLYADQIYELCTLMFNGVNITNNTRSGKTASNIISTFNKSMKIKRSAFEHNKNIREDIKQSSSHIFKITNISGGQAIINDRAKQDEVYDHPLDINHHRTNILETLTPIEINGEYRPVIGYVASNGDIIDTKTGSRISADKFGNKIKEDFVKYRGRLVAIVPQTDNYYTIFPIRPNTIMGSITDANENESYDSENYADVEARQNKLDAYVDFISSAIRDIFELDPTQVSSNNERLAITDRLQNVIICNEKSNPNQNDIYFQSAIDTDSNTGEKLITVTFKVATNSKGGYMYHKIIKRGNTYTHAKSIDLKRLTNTTFILSGNNDPGRVSISEYNESNVDNLYINIEFLIPQMIRQFGLEDGKSINKKDNTSEGEYIDPITGEKYNSIYDYYTETNAVYTDLGAIKDKHGETISNVSITGINPIKFSIYSNTVTSDGNKVHRWYDVNDFLKSMIKPNETVKTEDWKAINDLVNLLEELGVKPMFVKNFVENPNKLIHPAYMIARPSNIPQFTDLGLLSGYVSITLNYNAEYYNKRKFGITKAIAHELIHTFLFKTFHITGRDLISSNNKMFQNRIRKYNKDMIGWIEDFIASYNNMKSTIEEKSKKGEALTEDEKFIKTLIDKDVVDKLINAFNNEIERINKHYDKAANDPLYSLNGNDTIQEPVAYAFSDPVIFKLFNVLKSTTERKTVLEQTSKNSSLWTKLKNIIMDMFVKIAGMMNRKINEDSILERLDDIINNIYNTSDETLNNIDISDSTLSYSVAPGREEGEVRSDTNVPSSDVLDVNSTESDIDTEDIDINEEIIEEEDDSIQTDFGDDYYSYMNDLYDDSYKITNNNNQTSTVDEITKYLDNQMVNLDKNINFDDTNRILC